MSDNKLKIKFKRDYLAVRVYSSGIDGGCSYQIVKFLNGDVSEVLLVQQSGKRISNIHLWSDGFVDGDNTWLFDIPNEVFEVI